MIIQQSQKIFIVFYLFTIINPSNAQNSVTPDTLLYPKNFFRFPIMPGEQNFLTGTFAELRRHHFHGGLDIRTKQQEGLEVYSPRNGWVSKVTISKDGYGNLLYLTHPEGLQTLYAHLKSFDKPIQDFIRQKQYENEKADGDFYFPLKKFKYKTGQVVAFSGNTGSSHGPHLHWEIRDKKGFGINPMLYRFDELKDKVKPIIDKIALKTFDRNSRINGEFGRYEFALNDNNIPFKKIQATGLLGLEVNTWDLLSASSNHTGIFSIELFIDSVRIFTHSIEKVSVENSRQINAHTDYKTYLLRNEFFQKCYVEDGNRLTSYTWSDNILKGKFIIQENRDYHVLLKIKDVYYNESVSSFVIEGYTPEKDTLSAEDSKEGKSFVYDIHENLVKIDCREFRNNKEIFLFFPAPPKKPKTKVDLKGNKKKSKAFNNNKILPDDSTSFDGIVENDEIEDPLMQKDTFLQDRNITIKYILLKEPVYIRGERKVFFYDLRKGIPDSMSNGFKNISLNIKKVIYPGKKNLFKSDNIMIMFPVGTFNDTLYLEYESITMKDSSYVTEFRLNDRFVPAYKEFIIKIKVDTEKVNVLKTSGFSSGRYGGYRYEMSSYDKNMLTFKTKYPGTFKIIADESRPVIDPIATSSLKHLRFRIDDGLSGISSYRPTVDGKWILMDWDGKSDIIFTNPEDENIPAQGEFILEVTDRVGNISTYKKDFR